MDAWLTEARDALADAAGVAPDRLALDSATTKIVLDLARHAAHTSGDRRNAPLVCYLLGLAAASGADASALAASVTEPAARTE